MTITGKGNYTGTVTKSFAISPASLAEGKISEVGEQSYTGAAITPEITVTLGDKALVKDTDYTAAYTDNVNAGTAVITVTGKGNYAGTLTQSFAIKIPLPAVGEAVAAGSMKYQVTASAETGGTLTITGASSKSVTSVTIPDRVEINGRTYKVTAVANRAFKGCTRLKTVTIGSRMIKLGREAFYGCKSLKSMKVNTTVLRSIGKNALKGISKKAVIQVPAKKRKAYQKLFKSKGQAKTVKIK